MTEAVQLAIIAAIPATISAIGLWQGRRNFGQIKDLHTLVNSRMTERIEVEQDASFAKGVKSETDKAKP